MRPPKPLILFLLWLSACVPDTTPVPVLARPQPTITETIPTQVASGENISSLPSAGAAASTGQATGDQATPSATQPVRTAPPRTTYNLSARLTILDKTLRVRELVIYPNRTGDTQNELVFVIPGAATPGLFRLDSAMLVGQPLAAQARLEAGQLALLLPQPLAPGSAASIEINFSLALPPLSADALGPRAGLGGTERQINFHDWFPSLPPYQPGEGWLVHAAHHVGEHVVSELADYHVEIAVDHPGWSVVAPGQGEFLDGSGQFEHLAARAFAWSAGRGLETISQAAEGVTIESYFFPEHRAAGEAVLQVASQAMSLYRRLFGPYPFARLAVVEGDFLDGLESAGLIFVGRDYYEAYAGPTGGYLVPITAHEVAHQWWYGRVGNDPALEPWLDEALATYSEVLYYEAYHPEAVGWWWNVRVHSFAPKGKVGSPIYAFDSFRAYVDAVYLRGAQFLAALRQDMGEEAFFSFLRGYVAAFRGHLATTADFWKALEANRTVDDRLFEQYFQREGPDLPPIPEQVLLTPMQHEYQRWNNCGPASTAMALSHFGESLTQTQVAPELKGTEADVNVSPHEIAAYLQKLGYGAQVRFNGTVEGLMRLASLGLPVIVEQWLVRPDHPLTGHYRVVHGYDREAGELILNDAYNGPELRLGFTELDDLWQPFGRAYIVAYRPQDELLVRAALSADWDEVAMHRRALAVAQREIEADPLDVYAWFNLGSAHLGLGQAGQAAQAFEQAWGLGLPPRLPWYRFEPWEAFNAIGWYDRTLEYTSSLSEIAGTEEIHYHRGVAYVGLEMLDQAAAEFQAALADHPRFSPAEEALVKLEQDLEFP